MKKKNNSEENQAKEKTWNKSVIFTITAKELQRHIKAAARSGLCGGAFSR